MVMITMGKNSNNIASTKTTTFTMMMKKKIIAFLAVVIIALMIVMIFFIHNNHHHPIFSWSSFSTTILNYFPFEEEEAIAKKQGGIRKGGSSSSSTASGSGWCAIQHCSKDLMYCGYNNTCRKALLCNSKCQGRTNEVGCNLLCQFNYGYNNIQYKRILQCMAKNKCLPVLPMNGQCLATNDTVSNLTDYAQIAEGRWYILRGLNCGQPGWTGGFDAFPCQYDEFVRSSSSSNNNININDTPTNSSSNSNGNESSLWIDHIGYCGGNHSKCITPFIHTKAKAVIDTPGVLKHSYLDAPLLPQEEKWYVLSWPHPDWMLYVYCGSTPTGSYGGGSVVTRIRNRSDNDDDGSNSSSILKQLTNEIIIPTWIEREFQLVATRHGFDYNEMCQSDITHCPTTSQYSTLVLIA